MMTKEKFSVQYLMNSVPEGLLWNYISSDSGLQSWYAQKVHHTGDRWSFEWDGYVVEATMEASDEPEFIKFHNDDDYPEEYWELRISIDEMTDETVLTVTDFAEPDEIESEIDLWNAQIEELKMQLGIR